MTPVEMSLQVMWKGMVGIIIVIAIIIISTYILHFLVNKYEAMKQAKLAKDKVVESDNLNNAQ